MITYSKDHLLLIKHSRTLITQRADEDVISILRVRSHSPRDETVADGVGWQVCGEWLRIR